MEAILSGLVLGIVISTVLNIILKIRLRKLKKNLSHKQAAYTLFNAMISGNTELVSVELLNSTPLIYLRPMKDIFVKYYFSHFSQLKQTDALNFGFYLWGIYNQLLLDRKDYILSLLYEAAEPVRLQIWSDLLVQSIILENQLQEEGELNDIAELIGFIITISNQENNGGKLSEIFEAEIKKVLEVASFNEAWKNKIEVATMRICVSLNIEV